MHAAEGMRRCLRMEADMAPSEAENGGYKGAVLRVLTVAAVYLSVCKRMRVHEVCAPVI